MIGGLLKRVFGSANDRLLATHHQTVDAINALEPDLEALSDDELRARTGWLRQRYADGELATD